MVLELRRQHPAWGPRRIRVELARRAVPPLPSESGVYRAGLIEAGVRRRRRESWKRWEGGAPMELWQMDVVGGIGLADGSSVKALTGLDDHSRYCVSAALMPAERTRAVCDGLAAALRRYGLPQQLLTDNGKLFTGWFAHPPVEVLFDRICAGVRDRAPAHRPAVADDHRQDRAIPPEPARRVPHRPGVFLVADRAVRGRPVGRLLQHRPPAPGAEHGQPGSTLRPAPRPSPRRCCPPSTSAPAMTGSPAGWPATAWCASPGSRSASASITPAPAATCTSAAGCCSSGSGTNCARPSPAPAEGRYARSGHPSGE